MQIQDFKTYFKTLQILHFALLGFQLITMAIFGFLVHYHMVETDSSFPTNFIYMTMILPLVGVIGSSFLFKNFLQRIPDNAPIKEKLIGYQLALLVRYAVLEMPTLVLLVLYFISGNQFLLLAALLAAAYFFMMKPSRIRLIEDLELNQNEQIEMDNL